MGITRRTLIAVPGGVAVAAAVTTPAAAGRSRPPRPAIFIHGSAGSAMQFRVQGM